MLHTASFWHRTDLPRYSIAISQPRGMCLAKVSVMAPPKAIFIGLKEATIDWHQYTVGYLEHLDENESDVIAMLDKLQDNAVLCCWEKDPAKCHRSLLAGWLREHGIECEELQ